MKRLIFSLILAIVIALTVAFVSYRYGSGYVIFSFADVSVETSLIFALGVLILVFVIFHYALRALNFIIGLPLYLSHRKKLRRAEHARQSLIKGMRHLSEGQFSIAEKALVNQAPLSDTAMLNYLMAAHAAQQQNAAERRDKYLEQALKISAESEVAVMITRAKLQLANQQYDSAISSLLQVDSLSPKNEYIKKLLATAYQQAGSWTALSAMLDELRKNRLLSATDFSALEVNTYKGLLHQSSKQHNCQEVLAIWQKLPKSVKENGKILFTYAELLIAFNKFSEAETLIRQYLGKNWHEPLVYIFADINSDKPQQQLEAAESWLPQHRDSAILLLVLGKLCLKNKLWGKARTYFEASLSIKPITDTYLHLAMLLEDKMQESAKAQQLYQQGLKLAVSCGMTEPDMRATIKKMAPLQAV